MCRRAHGPFGFFLTAHGSKDLVPFAANLVPMRLIDSEGPRSRPRS